jgi:acyl-CoA thioesterase-2
MSRVLEELVALLTLERIEENLFRGQSQDLGWGTVYGGQVLGQALAAALQTVPPERVVHSMHAYFLRPGDVRRPIVYDVDRIRDGGSFTTRRVVALQKGQPIFNLAASFQTPEPGFDHADVMPEAPDPDTLQSEQALLAAMMERLPRVLRDRALTERPLEMRPVDPSPNLLAPTPQPPQKMVWLRAVAPLPDEPALHTALLAYASDWSLLTTALLPHGVTWLTPGMQVASIDHVMWFHRPVRMDEWVLHVIDSPSAQGARGLVRGRVFTRDGRLVASTAQEGLVRLRPPSP